MEFQRPVSENPLPIDTVLKNKLSPDELQRLTRAKSSVFKFERFADLLSKEEMDEKAKEEERRNEASKCSCYLERLLLLCVLLWMINVYLLNVDNF